MGECLSAPKTEHTATHVSHIDESDIVKAKLKQARDRINILIQAKNNDIKVIEQKINEKLPEYQRTGDKKIMVPLLKSKKMLT